MKVHFVLSLMATCVWFTGLVGCTPQPATPPSADSGTPAATAEHAEDGHDHEGAHGHAAGPHGGVVADWGGGKYHVEFTVDHDKKEATVYVLGDDEKTPVPIKAENVLLSIKQPAFQVELSPSPLDGETDGASKFVGTHEKLGVVQEFAGTISAEVDGTPYAGEFAEEAHDHVPK